VESTGKSFEKIGRAQGAPAYAGPTTRQPACSAIQNERGFAGVQQNAGNLAIQRLIQAKLSISQPDDPYENEADQVADQVMRMPEPRLQRKCECGGSPGLSDECSACSEEKRLGLQTKLTINKPGDIYEQEADRIADRLMATSAPSHVNSLRPRIQRFSGKSHAQMDAAPSSVNRALASPGRPVEPALRQDMEQRFGHDFSHVRVHTDTSAVESAHALSARAYTVGGDIVFGRGQYAPGASEGRRLLAHELTHVVQQSGGDEISPGLSPAQALGLPTEGHRLISTQRATASAITLQRDSTDDLADYFAHDLDDYVAKNPSPYAHILEVFHYISSDIEDNVAAAFTALQSSARLENFAATDEGRAMLDVLTEAMITGSVTLFESQQAERILVAKRKWISTEQYSAQAERIAGLRHKASPAFSEDQAVSQLAKDLDVYAANNLYAHVIEVFNDLPSNIEDNVAAEFVELQSNAKLEEFAETYDGRAMLDVLYEAMITGKVSSFESLQSERILIAKAIWIPPEEYVAQAERIATLRDVAEDSLTELAVDMIASEAAHELNADVAKQLYGDVVKKIHDLSSDIEDNVASHFIELQTPSKLEEFAANNDGRAMLDVLYEAIITGDVSAFEKMQAERILEAKAKRIPTLPPEQFLEQLKEERQYIFPLRMQKTFRNSYAIFKATLQPDGKVKVLYDDSIHFWFADMFKEDRAKLPPEARTGLLLNPDELVWLKLYDQNEKLVPVPAIALIDYANQAMRNSVSVGVTAFQAGLFVGFGGLGAFSGARVSALAAEVEAGEATLAALNLQKAVLWADRVAMALPLVSIVINENRDWILEKFPNAGPLLLGFLDQANRLTEYYGWARMGIDGARFLKSRLEPALVKWREDRAAAGKLSSSQRKAVEGIDGELEIIQNDLKKTEVEAGNKAVEYVEEHPNDPLESNKPGERSVKVDDRHRVVEKKDPATGAIHCEYQTDPIEVPCPKQWTQGQQEELKSKTASDPKTTAEPKPTEPPITAAPAVPLSLEEQRLQVLGDSLENAKTQLNNANQRLKELEKEGKARFTREHKEQQRKVSEATDEYVKAKNRLEAERRAQGISPRQLYERLRGRTPNVEMSRVASNTRCPYGPGESPDHIVPVIDIVELPGFERLPPKMQTEVLNIPENTIGLDPLVNSSKGDKLWSAKPGTSRYWEGHPDFGPIPVEARKAMVLAEERARAALERAIQERLQKLGL